MKNDYQVYFNFLNYLLNQVYVIDIWKYVLIFLIIFFEWFVKPSLRNRNMKVCFIYKNNSNL